LEINIWNQFMKNGLKLKKYFRCFQNLKTGFA